MTTRLPNATTVEREIELVAEMACHAPVTLLYGAAGSGKTTFARAVIANCSRTASRVALVFDSWDDPLRLRDSIDAALCARFGRKAVGRPLVSCSPADNLRAWHARLGLTFFIVFDQFEQYLARPEDAETKWFDADFIRTLSLPGTPVRLLLVLREDEKEKLGRLAPAIPGLHHSWIRLSARRSIKPPAAIPLADVAKGREGRQSLRLGLVATAAVLAVTVLAWPRARIASEAPAMAAALPQLERERAISSAQDELQPRPLENVPVEPMQHAAPLAPVTPRDAGAVAQAPAPSLSPQPLVYIHLRDEAQRREAERLVRRLPEKGITVSGIKLVERGPQAADLRYFRPAEAAEAQRVLRALDELGVQAQIKRIGGYETTATERQYELWLPPGS
jgi:hypothetical protein